MLIHIANENRFVESKNGLQHEMEIAATAHVEQAEQEARVHSLPLSQVSALSKSVSKRHVDSSGDPPRVGTAG